MHSKLATRPRFRRAGYDTTTHLIIVNCFGFFFVKNIWFHFFTTPKLPINSPAPKVWQINNQLTLRNKMHRVLIPHTLKHLRGSAFLTRLAGCIFLILSGGNFFP